MKLTVLAGGVGGARFTHGLYRLWPQDLSVVVNTGDDFQLHGLSICPDLDTVLYTLADWADPVQGWGLRGDTSVCSTQLARLGGETWFRLGDLDLATHLFRTQRLSQGASLTQVTAELAQSAGLSLALLPMCDSPVPTKLRLASGWVDFQDYFVRRQHADAVLECRYQGAAQTPPAAGVVQALRQAERILLAPSNPFLSLQPIFSLQGFAQLWQECRVRKLAISPMIGEAAVKGPLASLLASLGHPVNSLGIAHCLRDWVDTLVIDEGDRALQPAIEALGLKVVCTPTLMQDVAGRERLARLALDV
ncbi:2-phospho-L-lactate transferase [bacterium]|nr:2-phospho-L-lactate transferase [bacterium]